MGRLSDLLKKRQPDLTSETTVGDEDGNGIIPTCPVADIQYDGIGNLLVGRKRYAVGLEWEPIRPGETIKSQADRVQRSGYRRTLHARVGGQAGFASTDRQHRRGTMALISAARSGLLGPRWIGAFRVNEADRFWWVSATRDGEVYEDAILADEASARTLLMDALDAPDWTRIIAPTDWQVSGAVEARIEQVFDLKSGAFLRPVDGRREMIQRAVILSLIGAVSGGMYLYWADMQRQEAELAEEMRRARDVMVRVDPRSYPWATAVQIIPFVETCRLEIERSLFVVTGWSNEPIVCIADGSQGQVTTNWSRSGGRISWLRAATADLPEKVVLLEGGVKARLERLVSLPDTDSLDVSTPWTEAEVADIIQTRFQSLGLPINLRSRVRSLTTTQRQGLRSPVYNRHDLSLETSVAISEYARLLSDIPALVPEALIYSVEGGTWTLTAKIHHPPILPLPPS